MAKIYTGTSGWAYASWKPAFYPEKLPAKKFLSHYASRLNAVEVNYSFRRMLAEKTQVAWLENTPAGFLFCVKAHQVITHYKRLKNAEEAARSFLQSLQPLAGAGRLGPVLFQLPPNLKADAGLLRDFLAGLPRSAQLRCCFEFRHASWFCDEVYGLLRGARAALCAAESESLQTPEVETADFCYYRFRQPGYSSAQRAEIAEKLRQQQAAGKDVFAFFKHEESPEGALNAVEVLQQAQQAAA